MFVLGKHGNWDFKNRIFSVKSDSKESVYNGRFINEVTVSYWIVCKRVEKCRASCLFQFLSGARQPRLPRAKPAARFYLISLVYSWILWKKTGRKWPEENGKKVTGRKQEESDRKKNKFFVAHSEVYVANFLWSFVLKTSGKTIVNLIFFSWRLVEKRFFIDGESPIMSFFKRKTSS